MGDRPGLKVADSVGRVMHQLQVPQAAMVRFFEPLEFAVKKVQPFHVADDGRFTRAMRRLEIGCA